MKYSLFRNVLSVVCIGSIFASLTPANAGTIKFDQVIHILDAKPGRTNVSGSSQLRLANGTIVDLNGGDDDDDKKKGQKQDDRVITETMTEIVEDADCACEFDVEPAAVSKGFPKWPLLALGAVPLFFIGGRKTPTPTRTPTPTTQTPTPTTQTPTPTPTTPTPTTPTPPPTTPTPPPVPEPMTILLFGTGLAGIGVAARKKFGKKSDVDNGDE